MNRLKKGFQLKRWNPFFSSLFHLSFSPLTVGNLGLEVVVGGR